MGKHILDNKDFELLRLLQEDAHLPFREIAKKLDVAEGTVVNRLNKLKASGIIKGFTAILNPLELGFDLTVLIGLRVKGGSLREVEEEIAKRKEVLGVYDITGEYDAMIIARFRNRNDLNSFIKSVLSMKNVERTNTHLALNIAKEDFRVRV